MKRLLGVTLLVCLIFGACGKDDSDSKVSKKKSTPTSSKSSLKFKSCDSDFECATLKVARDYKKPDGDKISIAIVKLSAANPKKRIGALLVNPGGPGQPGKGFAESISGIFPQDMLDKYDIVGWDPRGTGDSTRTHCTTNLDPMFEGVDYSPDTPAEETKLIAATATLGAACEKSDEELLPYLSTEQSVRDMESIRKAFGDDKISYLGFSYGTALGQMYATLFPKRVHTMVIDGVLNLEGKPEDIAKEQTVGFEGALTNFFEYCGTNTCTFAPNGKPLAAYQELSNQIDARPVKSKTDSSLTLGPAQMDLGTSYYLYLGVNGWGTLDKALKSLQSGDPTGILQGFTNYIGRGINGEYDGSYEAFLSIGCADGSVGTAQDMLTLGKSIAQDAPVFGESGVLLGLPCATWPGVHKAEVFDVKTDPKTPIVVIGTTGDPATPVAWARAAAEQISDSVYVEFRGEGHTAYGQGNACIDNLVNTYFITGKRPNSKVCTS